MKESPHSPLPIYPSSSPQAPGQFSPDVHNITPPSIQQLWEAGASIGRLIQGSTAYASIPRHAISEDIVLDNVELPSGCKELCLTLTTATRRRNSLSGDPHNGQPARFRRAELLILPFSSNRLTTVTSTQVHSLAQKLLLKSVFML